MPYALVDLNTNNVTFLSRDRFLLLFHCDGIYEFANGALSALQLDILKEYIDSGVVIESTENCSLEEKQRYWQYPARFKESAQWSITGNCNLHCRHCFMSSPEGALGELRLSECLEIISQLAECGVGKVSLTGGEPLIRRDFWKIVDALCEKNIKLTTLFSNGMLVNDTLLDRLEARGMYPQIQISFDGTGYHDWLRGFDGAERKVIEAFQLCRNRGFKTSAAMCLNRRNAGTLRESVQMLSQLGCSGLKVNNTYPAGEWLNERSEYLDDDKCFGIYMKFIPEFFADGAPMSLMLDGMFAYMRDEKQRFVPFEHNCTEGSEAHQLLCAHNRRELYISPQGTILPCMSMAGSAIEKKFPNVFQTPLKEILSASDYMRYVDGRLDAYLQHNSECRSCMYRLRCCGGCRASAIGSSGEDYFLPDLRACSFFKNGWADAIKEFFDATDERMKYNSSAQNTVQ